MLCERMAPKLEKPTVLSAEQSLRFRVRSLIDAFNGPFGKIVASTGANRLNRFWTDRQSGRYSGPVRNRISLELRLSQPVPDDPQGSVPDPSKANVRRGETNGSAVTETLTLRCKSEIFN
jgi:hypothetical protein